MELTLGGSWIAPAYSMISGQGQAMSRELKVASGKDGRRWLYNDDLSDAGGFVYVEGGPRSDGFTQYKPE